MCEDMKKFNEMLDKTFPEKSIGEKEDLVIRQWLEYATVHTNSHPCKEFRAILRVRGSQILELSERGM